MRFDWDAENTAHVAEHGLSTTEVEAIVTSESFEVSGISENGLIVGHAVIGAKGYRVVFSKIAEDCIRPITAFRISRGRIR